MPNAAFRHLERDAPAPTHYSLLCAVGMVRRQLRHAVSAISATNRHFRH